MDNTITTILTELLNTYMHQILLSGPIAGKNQILGVQFKVVINRNFNNNNAHHIQLVYGPVRGDWWTKTDIIIHKESVDIYSMGTARITFHLIDPQSIQNILDKIKQIITY